MILDVLLYTIAAITWAALAAVYITNRMPMRNLYTRWIPATCSVAMAVLMVVSAIEAMT